MNIRIFLLVSWSINILGLCDTWQTVNYIWDFGIISQSQVGMNRSPRSYFANEHYFDINAYQNIRAGDIVWVRCRFIPEFCAHILPKITFPIILLISDGDETFPSDIVKKGFDIHQLINNDYIVHIFAQNNDYSGDSKKISSIPIGMDFHTIAYKGTNGGWGEIGSPIEQESKLNGILQSLNPTHLRKRRVFVDFHLADTMHGENQRYLQLGEDRKSIFEKIIRSGVVDYSTSFMRRSLLWRTKGEYAFSVSPHGNGLDCHRTWEDLVLGCIVIVKTSPLDCLYEGLPVVIIKDWSEITNENLQKWLEKFYDAFTNSSYREKLTNRYWLTKIMAARYQIMRC